MVANRNETNSFVDAKAKTSGTIAWLSDLSVLVYLQVNLRVPPPPSRSTPKNKDLAEVIPELIFRFFTEVASLLASRSYSFANRLLRG
jgi:hypothetical protein